MAAWQFSADEQDVVTELMNMGVGRAAASFSRLVGDEVVLSVPLVRLADAAEAETAFADSVPEVVAGVTQSFEGLITGTAALLFPGERSLELVRAVIGEDLPADEISELEQETLAEIGNIILNSCLATIANALKTELHASLPEPFHAGRSGLTRLLGDSDTFIMLVQIDFSLKSRNLEGYLAFVVDLRTAAAFRGAIAAYLHNLGG
ncbi:chemotaxis protein CheC [Caenispirillum bisanense]|uniref:chemotaxis protein CheC n=1 Tax=Caenispirillum bisanense TaxID=414052 RepID=UPI0031E23EE4